MTDKELISAAVEASGLSVRRFAKEILTRAPRTVWRWLAGTHPMPQAVRERCADIVKEAQQ